MAIAFVQAGAGNTGTAGATTFSITGCVAGNFLTFHILCASSTPDFNLNNHVNVEALDGTDNAMTTFGSNADVGSPRAAAHFNYFGRVIANGTVSVDGNFVTGDLYGRWYEFSGVNTGRTFNDVAESGGEVAGTAAQIDDLSVTTLGTERLAVQLVGVNDDNVVGAFTGATGGTWVENAQYNSATGTQATLQLQTCRLYNAGTINGGSYTMAASDPWGILGFALISGPLVAWIRA